MIVNIRGFLRHCLVCLVGTGFVSPVFSWNLGALVRQRFQLSENELSSQSPPDWNRDALFYSLAAQGFFDTRFKSDTWRWVAQLNSGSVRFDEDDITPSGVTFNGRPFDDAWIEEDLFFQEFYVRYRIPNGGPKPSWVRLGKQRFVLGNAFIYDDFTWGASGKIYWDVAENWRMSARADAGLLFHSSPFMHGEWTIEHQTYRWTAFGLYYKDEEESFSELIEQNISDQLEELIFRRRDLVIDIRDDLWATWFGTKVEGDFGSFFVRATGMGLLGQVTFSNNINVNHVRTDLSGWLGDIVARYRHPKNHVFEIYLLAASGSSDLSTETRGGRLKSFFGIAPWVDRSHIFFTGGLDQDLSARTISFYGPSGRGVFSTGISWSMDVGEHSFRAGVAGFWTDRISAQGEGYYGTEFFSSSRVNIRSWLDFVSELDVFLPGAFYGYTPPAAVRGVLGVDVFL